MGYMPKRNLTKEHLVIDINIEKKMRKRSRNVETKIAAITIIGYIYIITRHNKWHNIPAAVK